MAVVAGSLQADVPSLRNSDLEQVANGRFVAWEPLGAYTVEEQTARVECASGQDTAGLVQILRCDPPLTNPFTASARARALGVGNGGDFALWVDLIHVDGSPSWGHAAGFARGTHDWEPASIDITPTKPVAEVRFHLLLRHTTGQAWFSEPRLTLTPVSFTRLQAVAGLWGPDSLSIRAETNLKSAIEITGLANSPTSQPALDHNGITCWELQEGATRAIRGALNVKACSLAQPANRTEQILKVEGLKASGSSPGWRAWADLVSTRVFVDAMPKTEIVPCRLDAVRDGHVSIQVAVAANPHGDDQIVDVVMQDLVGNAARLAGDSWERHRVGFVRNEQPARHPHLEHEGPAWWPDPLLVWQPLSVPHGQARSVVLNLRIPSEQPAGTYEGNVRISDKSGRNELIPVQLELHDFTLPRRPRIKTAFALMDGFLEKVYGKITPELRRAYTGFVLDHRLNPDDISRTRLPDLDELSWAKDRGLNAFNILNLVPEAPPGVTWVCFAETKEYTSEFKTRLIERLDAFVPELEKRGLLDYAYVYGFDERGKEYIPIMREYFGLIKERYPRVRTLSTCWPPAGTDPASLNVDWYCPLSNKYDVEMAEKVRVRGGEMWWYICMGPTYPYANWMLEYPLVESRVIWWQTWQQKVDGLLYWGLNIWDRAHNDKPIPDNADALLSFSVTPFEPLHGDGVLLYPGERGPLGSLRLLSIRDGMEDAMLLDAAERKLGRERVEQTVRRVSRGVTDFAREATVLHEARQEILRALR